MPGGSHESIKLKGRWWHFAKRSSTFWISGTLVEGGKVEGPDSVTSLRPYVCPWQERGCRYWHYIKPLHRRNKNVFWPILCSHCQSESWNQLWWQRLLETAGGSISGWVIQNYAMTSSCTGAEVRNWGFQDRPKLQSGGCSYPECREYVQAKGNWASVLGVQPWSPCLSLQIVSKWSTSIYIPFSPWCGEVLGNCPCGAESWPLQQCTGIVSWESERGAMSFPATYT